MTFLASLNPQQREAVTHGDGPMLILAGAGSGKTRVIVCRIARLILERGVAPESVLAVTFTNKAAGEMRERVTRLLAENGLDGGPVPHVSTFHSFCVRLLRRYGAPLADRRKGFGTDFLIFDRSDQAALVKDAVEAIGPKAQGIKPNSVLASISRLKNRNVGSGMLKGADAAETRVLNEIFERYEAALLAANALDFDDLLLEALRLLDSFEPVRAAVQDRYRHLLVDEFQDTNKPQYEILRQIAGPRPNVCVVGDDDQAIYSWRGAEITNILGFETDFPGTKVIRLEQNYRSTQAILSASSAVVAQNSRRRDKQLWTDGPAGDRPVLYRATDGDAEARFVARKAGELLDSDSDMRVAILYRTNAQSRLFEEALRREGREFLVVGGVAFYQRAEVKDLLAYLRSAMSPGDAVSLRRIINTPARGIGRSTLARLGERASANGTTLWRALEEAVDGSFLPPRARKALEGFRGLMTELTERLREDAIDCVLEWILEKSGYGEMLRSDDSPEARSRLENVEELLVAARESAERGEEAENFLDHAALVADADGIDEAARILLMTLHTAKGLEFPAVMMVGMEETLLPHSRSIDGQGEALEEERRLCYVGMTRARRHLMLTCAGLRRQYGAGPVAMMRPSRFLAEIPQDLLDDCMAAPGLERSGRPDDGWPGQRSRVMPSGGGPQEPSAVKTAGIQTHDSAAAVAGFFKSQGIDTGVAPGTPPRPGTARSNSRGRDAPRLGQALKELRRQGPFARGTRVRHKKFGVGVVQAREGEGPTAKLTVHFRGYGLKKLVAQYANLQEV